MIVNNWPELFFRRDSIHTWGETRRMRSRNTLIRMQRFLVDEKRRDVTQIEQMVADFETKQTELQSQIEAEQDSSGIFDVTHFF